MLVEGAANATPAAGANKRKAQEPAAVAPAAKKAKTTAAPAGKQSKKKADEDEGEEEDEQDAPAPAPMDVDEDHEEEEEEEDGGEPIDDGKVVETKANTELDCAKPSLPEGSLRFGSLTSFTLFIILPQLNFLVYGTA